jgi:sulfate permease, SulP family
MVKGYQRSSLKSDLVAGAVVAALLIPQALGYAVIAHVPLQVGLYAIPFALLVYAARGSSRQLIVGPISTASVVTGSVVATVSHGDPAVATQTAVTLALVAGVVLVVTGLLPVGWAAEFLSKAIATGFVFGLTLTIIIGELPTLLGVKAPGSTAPQKLWNLAGVLGDFHPTTLLVGAVALVVLFGGSALAPRLPWSLLTVIGAIACSSALDLEDHGVVVVGRVPGGLPSLALPHFGSARLAELLTGGVLVALVVLAEGLAAARLYAQQGNYSVDTDKELVAVGLANVAAACSGGMAVGGSLSKTAASVRAGGRTQATGLVTGLIAVATLLLFTSSLATLPRAALSAVVIHAVWGLMDVAALRRYRLVRVNDFVAAIGGLVGVLVAGPFYGLVLAIAVSLLGIVYRQSKIGVDVLGKIPDEKAAWGSLRNHPERRAPDGVLVLRPTTAIFWANAERLREQILAFETRNPGLYAILLDLEATHQFDSTSLDMLYELMRELRRRGVDLYLVRVFRLVRTVLRRGSFLEELGEDHMWHSISAGLRAARTSHRAELDAQDADDASSDDDASADDDERVVLDQDETPDEPEPARHDKPKRVGAKDGGDSGGGKRRHAPKHAKRRGKSGRKAA